jgi:hypothetical protein
MQRKAETIWIRSKGRQPEPPGFPIFRLCGDGVFAVARGNAGPLYYNVSDRIVGVTGLVRHFRLAGPMIVTRWVRAGLPHTEVAGRRIFDTQVAEKWLKEHGYSVAKLKAGKGLAASRLRRGATRWRKGQMNQPPETEEHARKEGEQPPAGGDGRSEQARP